MRSILFKIIGWSVLTFFVSLFANWLIARWLEPSGPGPGDPSFGLIRMIQMDAFKAYEDEGAAGLSRYLDRLSSFMAGERVVLDAEGRDLVSGANRPDLMSSNFFSRAAHAASRRPGGVARAAG